MFGKCIKEVTERKKQEKDVFYNFNYNQSLLAIYRSLKRQPLTLLS